MRIGSGLVSWYDEPSGERPRRLLACFRRRQKKTPNPMIKPSPSATPNTMPTTLSVLIPPLLLTPFSVGSAVGVTRIVFTIPVTVVTIVNGVMAVVRAFVGVVEGVGVWGVSEGVEVVDTTTVLNCITKALATGT